MQYPSHHQHSGPPAPLFDGTQACAGRDLNLFFPAKGHDTRAAKAICATCRFLEPCLDYAVHAQGVPGRYVAGVWGGTGERERLALRCGHGSIRHPVAAAS